MELTKGLRALFERDKRRKVIAEIWHVNFVIYSTTLMVSLGNKGDRKLPYVIMGEETVDPLRDERVAEIVRKQGMKHCCVTPWSFGRKGEVMHGWLSSPNGIARNSSGQFIVGRVYEVNIFDPTGQFIQHSSLPLQTYIILDVATDTKDNMYVLVSGSVYKFSNTADLHHKFPVRGGFRVTVTNNKVLVLSSNVDVYDTDGLFLCSIGEGRLEASSITAANDGRVLVADWRDSCVHIFGEDGHHLDKFQLQGGYIISNIAFHMLNEQVVITGVKRGRDIVVVEIFTKDGVFVRSTEIDAELIVRITGMTVTRDDRIAVVGFCFDSIFKVLVI